MPGRALLLVGHGSHLSADSSAPVYAHAARIREMGVFDEVLEAFWKEEPSLRDALDLVESEEIYIVPLFLAEGYFTRQVLPRELGIDGAETRRGGRTIRYCPPVGTHPSMASLVVRRALEMPGLSESELPATTLLIIGHGTTRSRTSGDTVYRLVEEIRAMGLFGAVDCGFLDEAPRITEVLARTDASTVALVPFFLAEGWHTATTIPEEIGLDEVPSKGRRTWYSPPVGTMPEMADVILELVAAEKRGSRRSDSDDGPPQLGSDLDAGSTARPPLVSRARDHFADWLRERRETSTVMQVAIARFGDAGYRLSHVIDSVNPEALTPVVSWPALRELVRVNDRGDYRPLRTRDDLPSGWAMELPDESAVWEALSIIYPAALLHWFAMELGELEVVPFERWANRQTGIYEAVRNLSEDGLRAVVERCCGSCLRRPSWLSSPASSAGTIPERTRSARAHSAGDGVVVAPIASSELHIPCREPCTLFATVAREFGRQQ